MVTRVHIGNFRTYLCGNCIVSLEQVLKNLEKQVQQISGNMIPEEELEDHPGGGKELG